MSHDLEDIVTVIDGRTELADELQRAEHPLRAYVTEQAQALLAHPELLNALPGIVAQPIRVSIVLERLQRIASLST